ncbi:MAG: HAD superfamily hydrolase (TIGR01450 family) [Oleiphilaceae bacterium]|jgi:HAD superfamily hydrolase (TIGR01450 family)
MNEFIKQDGLGVILAAGVGSRLRPMTNRKPKCLVTVAGKTMLQYQIDAYVAASISEVVIVVGYESDAIIDYCKHIKNIKVTIVENDVYEDTNNMYSLYLAAATINGRPFILNNADLAIDSKVVDLLVKEDIEDLVAVDKSLYNDESMKVSVNEDGYISDISKNISFDHAFGCSIDYYKFSRSSAAKFLKHVKHVIEEVGEVKDWTEVAMQNMFANQSLKFRPLDISGLKWVEIDNYDDLAIADKIFSQEERELLDYQHYCFDLDGTIHVAGDPIENVIETIKKLKVLGKNVSFISNNSSKTVKNYVDFLSSLNLDVLEEDIELSFHALITYMQGENVNNIYVLGTKALKNEFANAGFNVETEDPEYVVVGYDTELTYDKLVRACMFINRGVDILATHCDMNCPSQVGPIPDIGALLEMLKATTGGVPKRVFGKPDKEVLQSICNRKNLNITDTVMIGDRIYTDIAMAHNSNCSSILVLSGDTSRDEVESQLPKPTHILKSAADILN